MANNLDKDPDSLVDALESIKNLLAKSDSKLAAARESIALASSTQTAQGSADSEQFEIPVLDDVVSQSDVESVSAEVSNISEELSSKIDETIAAVNESIPTLTDPVAGADPKVLLDYLDTLQEKLEKSLRDSLMKSIVTIEAGLKKSLVDEVDKIREQIKKDFE